MKTKKLLLQSFKSRSSLCFLGLVLVFVFIFPGTGGGAEVDGEFYYKIDVNFAINPVAADYFERAMHRARSDSAAGLLVRLDTPGGLMKSMSRINSAVLNSELPVIVWVGPSGARAASAGAFVTYAAHVASMARGTRIGAAHPVAGRGKNLEGAMEDKAVEDAVAQITNLARRRDRNETYAENFVRESVSIGEEEALANNVVDLRAGSISELVESLDSRRVEISGARSVVLEELPVNEIERTFREKFFGVLLNPNLVYIFLTLGIYGLIYEFSNPGLGFGLATGGVCLLLALYGMNVLPVSYAGLGLLLLGVVLMILDVFVPSFGILTTGGLFSFVLGSVMLFDSAAFAVSPAVIAGVGLATLAFVLLLAWLVFSSWDEPVKIGDDSLESRSGVVKETLDPEGVVHVWGEYWTAEAKSGGTIEKGRRVVVLEEKRHKLLVEPETSRTE